MLDATASLQDAPDRTSAAPPSRCLMRRIKRYGWRATATLIWIAAVALLAQSLLGVPLPHFAGLWSNHPAHMRAVVLSGLLLLLTGFSFGQLLGFAAYLAVFPAVALIWWFFPRWLSSWRRAARGPRPSPVLAMTYVTASSFLLIGHGQNVGQDWLQLIIAAIWACLICHSLLRSLGPPSPEILDSVGQVSASLPKAVASFTAIAPPKSQVATEILLLLGAVFWTFVYVMRTLRRNAALIVLADGVAKMFALLAACIGVWAYAVRIASDRAIRLGAAVRASCAHFLPGFPPPHILGVPAWVHVGAALNAWFLVILLALLAGALHASNRALCNAIGRNFFDAEMSALVAYRKQLMLSVASFKAPASDQATRA